MRTSARLAVAVAFAALLVVGCSDVPDPVEETAPEASVGADAPLQDDEIALTVPLPPSTVEPEETDDAPETDDATTDNLAPEVLAFASTRDLGRLYEIDPAAEVKAPSASPAGDADGSPIAANTVLQAVEAKSRGGDLWVRLVDAESDERLGWLPASSLVGSIRTVIGTDIDTVGQFLQVTRIRSTSFLNVRSAPDIESAAVDQFGPDQIFMHGGRSATTPDGTIWVDAIDPADRSEIGWVVATFTTTADRLAAHTSDGTRASVRGESGVTYGAAIRSGRITGVGCNSVLVTLSPDASETLGTRLLIGSEEPKLLDGVWQLDGGTNLFSPPGESVQINLPSSESVVWWILPVTDDGAAASAGPAEGGFILDAGLASEAVAFPFEVQADSCGEIQSADPNTGISSGGDADGSGGVDPSDDSDESSPATTIPAPGDPPSAAPDGFATTGG